MRDRFQFWFFHYATGSPIPYSAMLLRDALTEAVAQLDPEGTDPALRQMVVIGHSQGGLLAKMTAVDSGTRIWDTISRKPIAELDVSGETRELLERALFVRPLPFVRRVIFIATPHGGSAITTGLVVRWLARFVTLPVDVLGATADLLEGNSDALLLDPRRPALRQRLLDAAGQPVPGGPRRHADRTRHRRALDHPGDGRRRRETTRPTASSRSRARASTASSPSS